MDTTQICFEKPGLAQTCFSTALDTGKYLCTPYSSAFKVPVELRVKNTDYSSGYYQRTIWFEDTVDTTTGYSRSFKVSSFVLSGNCENFHLELRYLVSTSNDRTNCISYSNEATLRKDSGGWSKITYLKNNQFQVFCEKATKTPTTRSPTAGFSIPPDSTLPPVSRPTAYSTPSSYYNTNSCATGCSTGVGAGGFVLFCIFIAIVRRIFCYSKKPEGPRAVTQPQSNNSRSATSAASTQPSNPITTNNQPQPIESKPSVEMTNNKNNTSTTTSSDNQGNQSNLPIAEAITIT